MKHAFLLSDNLPWGPCQGVKSCAQKRASLSLFILAHEVLYSFPLHQLLAKFNTRDAPLALVRE